MTKRFSQIDTSTGEIVEGFVAVLQPKKQNGFRQGWLSMNQAAMNFMATSDLGAVDYKVFFQLLTHLDFENLIQLNQTELAAELGMKKPNVSRSIKNLLKLGVLHEGPKIGRCKTYRLDPNLGWKGTASNHHKALRGRMAERNMEVIK